MLSRRISLFAALPVALFGLILFAGALFAAGSSGLSTRHLSRMEWIDKATGHRIVQLSWEPDSHSLYFNLNAYTKDGQSMVFTAPSGIKMVNLKSHAIEILVPAPAYAVMVGLKFGRLYYIKDHALFSMDVNTRAPKKLFILPPHWTINAINCDETMAAGTITETDQPERNSSKIQTREDEIKFMKSKGEMMEERLASKTPMELFFLDLRTGKVVNRCQHGTDWLGHLQFSPTDPTLLLFCHEGMWHNVTRIWLVHADGSGLTCVHPRTMQMEIAGHEFWSADGSTVWYDLQTPRGVVFWLAGYNVKTGKRTWYHLTRDEWSVHYNCSPDGKMFAGDGGGPGNVAHADDGKWLYLFRPDLTPNRMEIPSDDLITAGVFQAEKLVNLKNHTYDTLEPNVRFTPDGKWLIFRSDLRGAPQIYEVEIGKAN